MSLSLILNTYLIQSDLHCISAMETLKHAMGIEYVLGLTRYKQTRLTFSGSAPTQAVVDEALKGSYFFVNPNKEHYSLGVLPTLSDSSKLHIQVSDASPVHEAEGLAKAKDLFGEQVISCETSLIWVVHLDESAPSQDEVLKTIIETNSRQKGLLMNPVFEKLEVLTV